MSQFNNTYNYNDSKIRSIIIAIVGEFQNKIKFRQYTDSNEYALHTVPFYYSLTGSEDFLLDNFMSSDYSVLSTNEIDNNYEVVPRGILTMESLDIDSGALINRHVRTEIPKKVDETTYKMYSYETVIIPINLSFSVKIICNSNIEMLKITETLISNLYKVNNFYVDFGGYHVRGSMSLPESFDREQLFEFGFTDKKVYDITFSVDVQTSFPVFDEKSEMFLGNRILEFGSNIYDISVAPDNGLYSNYSENNINSDFMKFDEKIVK
jgi:hypothetical protein